MTNNDNKEVCRLCIFSKIKNNYSIKEPSTELECGVINKNIDVMIYEGDTCPKGFWKDSDYSIEGCGCVK